MKNPIEYLIYWANICPQKIAIQNTVSNFKYNELLDRVCKISGKLKTLGIRPQQKVVLSMSEDHFRWVFTLALFHTGATVISASDVSTSKSISDSKYDWIISDKLLPSVTEVNLIIIDRPWLESIRELKINMDFYHYQESDLICLFDTSGTTGVKKRVAWNSSHLEQRAKAEIFNTGTSNKITLMGSTSNLGFYTGFSAFIFGETLFTEGSPDEVIELIDNFGIKTLHGSPSQIAFLLEPIIENGNESLVNKLDKVITAGSLISPTLLGNIQKYLSTNIYSDYGSTETGFACRNIIQSSQDLNSIGFVVPGVVLEVMDDSDNELLHGEVGKIRIRTPYMVTSYFENSKESDIFFKDGWFYPGDRGYINNNNQITIVGRTADLINIGGVKINQFILDMFFLKFPKVKDAAVFTYQNLVGDDQLAVAIVSEEPLNIDILKENLINELGPQYCPKRFFRAIKIPRNNNGKVSRTQLASDILSLEKK